MSTFISTKWQATGLLDGLSDDQKEECSNYLEETANFLIDRSKTSDKKFFDESYAGMMIPIVRRIYDSELRNIMPDIEWLCYDFASHIKKSKITKEDHYKDSDYEVELVSEYTKELVKRKSK
jgi:hypothetical protein